MNWKALQAGKCPKCNTTLTERGVMLLCKCSFIIRKSRVKEILENKPSNSGVYRPENSEEQLIEIANNDGYEEVAEDFSDSSFLK